jgi:hypothetical protein
MNLRHLCRQRAQTAFSLHAAHCGQCRWIAPTHAIANAAPDGSGIAPSPASLILNPGSKKNIVADQWLIRVKKFRTCNMNGEEARFIGVVEQCLCAVAQPDKITSFVNCAVIFDKPAFENEELVRGPLWRWPGTSCRRACGRRESRCPVVLKCRVAKNTVAASLAIVM